MPSDSLGQNGIYPPMGGLGQAGSTPSLPTTSNPLLGTPIQPQGAHALALMQLLLPKTHKFIQVDHDPFATG